MAPYDCQCCGPMRSAYGRMTPSSSPTPCYAPPNTAAASLRNENQDQPAVPLPSSELQLFLLVQGPAQSAGWPLGPQACYGPDGRALDGQATVRTMPPAGDRPAPGWRGRRSRLRVRSGVRGELPSRPPSTQAEPSRRGPWRPGRSYSGALHLDAMNHARSTVCGSTADGMGAGEVVGVVVVRLNEGAWLATRLGNHCAKFRRF